MKPSANLSLTRYEWGKSAVEELLAQAPSGVVLDIGAGDGKMGRSIQDCSVKLKAFDLRPQSAQIEAWDLDYPPSGRWERGGIALLLDVIEHCNNPWLAMRHVSQLLLPGGFLILTTPNPRWSRSRFHAVGNGVPTCFTQGDLDDNHHVFTPWPHIVEKLLSDSGMRVVRYVTLDGRTKWPRPNLKVKYPARVLLAAANKLIEFRDSSSCGMSYGLLAEKVRD